MQSSPTNVLFVCLGNICRSPLAEGVFRQTAHEAGNGHRFRADSAGTGSWHVGDPPHSRSVAVAARHGIDISAQRCRQLGADDLARFDVILGMDRANVEAIERLRQEAGAGSAHIGRLLDFAGRPGDVPDPYHGGREDYEAVFRLIAGAMPEVMTRLLGPATRRQA